MASDALLAYAVRKGWVTPPVVAVPNLPPGSRSPRSGSCWRNWTRTGAVGDLPGHLGGPRPVAGRGPPTAGGALGSAAGHQSPPRVRAVGPAPCPRSRRVPSGAGRSAAVTAGVCGNVATGAGAGGRSVSGAGPHPRCASPSPRWTSCGGRGRGLPWPATMDGSLPPRPKWGSRPSRWTEASGRAASDLGRAAIVPPPRRGSIRASLFRRALRCETEFGVASALSSRSWRVMAPPRLAPSQARALCRSRCSVT